MKKAAIILATLLTSACASQPWSEVTGDWQNVASKDQYNVNITGVNGKLKFDNQQKHTFEPGKVELRLTTTKQGQTVGQNLDRNRNKTVELDLKPCVRYYMGAQHESSLSSNVQDWQPVILKQETISSCEKLLDKKSEPNLKETKLSI